ncbi:hypothetical protein MIZ03_3681 [Rhodoferax lithotrophicus]|uniref:Uncharacterized protein n=1 Tax=Rhodoferax lithotrophicus TaxID=2798804 RepID=A0ABN6DDB9_9BURK|nr:hypothetical protein MIZ03_3681 [Rhodoferax sp. MIZ03]
MFALMTLMTQCLQRENVLFFGIHQPSVPVKRAQHAIKSIANSLPNPIAPLHAPIPRLIV